MTLVADLRIGIWVDVSRVSKQQRDFVVWARSQPHIVVSAFLVSPDTQLESRFNPLQRALFKMLLGIESLRLRQRDARYRECRDRFELVDLASSGSTPIVSSADKDRLQPLELDLVVFLGAVVPVTGTPVHTKLGTLALEDADPSHHGGVPAGFWEVFQQRDTTSFALKQFDAARRTGAVLLRGAIPTRHFYLLNEAALQDKAYHYLRTLVSAAAASGHLPVCTPKAASALQPASTPSASQIARYLLRSVRASLHRRWKALRGREEVWQVAFLRSKWRGAPLEQGIAIDNPPGRYLADPFVIQRDGVDYCFVEDLDRAQQRGCISVYRLGATSAERIGIVIDEPFHLSFPFLFEHNGTLYMCPESSANRDIRLYRCMEFPTKWQLAEIVASDVSAVDTMIFEKNGKWWRFSNMDPGNTGEISSELFIFSADSPLGAAWRPHAANPVLIDAGRARNAGLLVDEGKVFRVSQRQGFARYGKSSQINEIVDLTDDSYSERCVATIEPTFRKGLLGTHHFHSRGGMTVFDFLTETSSPSVARRSHG